MRGEQIGISFTAGDPLHARVLRASSRLGLRRTRVVRDVLERYLDLWEAEQIRERARLARRAARVAGRKRRKV